MTTQLGAISFKNLQSGEIGAWDLKPNGTFDKGNLFDLTVPGNARLSGAADFNSDGKKDLVFQDTVTGDVGIAYSKVGGGFTQVALTDKPGTGWRVGGVGEVNADGYNDIVFQGVDGRVAVWNFNGVQRDAPIAGEFVTNAAGNEVKITEAGWKLVGVGNFAGGASGDLLWENTATNEIAVWEMDGSKLLNGSLVTLPVPKADLSNWDIVGTGEIDGDGKTDIVWQNKVNGDIGYWKMNGKNYVSGAIVGTGSLGWEATSTHDTSVANPLASYKGARQNIQLNFGSDSGLDTHTKNAAISLAGIVEGAIGGKTNLPKDFTLKLSVDKSAVENLNAILKLN